MRPNPRFIALLGGLLIALFLMTTLAKRHELPESVFNSHMFMIVFGSLVFYGALFLQNTAPLIRQTILYSIGSVLAGFGLFLLTAMMIGLVKPYYPYNLRLSALVGLAGMVYVNFFHTAIPLLAAAGNYRVALAHLNRILRLRPGYKYAYAMRGYLLAWQGDYESALEDYSIAIAHYKRLAVRPMARHQDYNLYYDCIIGRAMCYAEMLDYRRALEECNEGIRLKPDSSYGYIHRAVVYLLTERYDAAEADLQRAAALPNPPDNEAVIFACRGLLNYARGDDETAMADYKLALKVPLSQAEKRRVHPSVYENIGCLCYRQGDFEAALTYFQKGLALDGENKSIIAGLAITAHTLDKRDEAYHLWHTLLRREPKFNDATWVREKYYRWTGAMAKAAGDIIADIQQSSQEYSA